MASKKSLQAAAATSGMFIQAKEQSKPVKGTKAPKKEAEAPKKETKQAAEPKRETATFSVKIDSEVLKKWRIYTSMDGYGDKGRLTEAAISEYMNRHKLSQDQQKRFEALAEL